MTVRKQYPTRDYETFPGSEDTLNQSPTSYQRGGDADKSRSAAAEAQRLASQGSWADNFTPATERTPIASTVDNDEVRDVRYPNISQDDDPSDPPPVYTPSVSTQVASQSPVTPASPVAARSVPAPVPEPDGRYQLPNFGSKPSQPSQKPWPPPEREHRENETSRSITGTYQLYDLLDLSSTSGSITVIVEVQPGDKPAVLRLASTSGSVHVKLTSGGGLFKKRTISEAARSRVLQTEISSTSGSVSGDVVHGNGGSTSVSTNSGSISLDVFTVGVSERDPQSSLSTVSNQGSQNVRVVSDVASTEAIRAIQATHTVRGSGSMNIDYPPEWEGVVHLTAHGSGSIGAGGRGLVVRKESSRELYGYRGATEGRKVEITELGSGSVRFNC